MAADHPARVLVAGDWHGATSWATTVIRRLPKLLPEESPRLILHCGDFGVWPGPSGLRYIRALDRALVEADAVLWFVDGNHEDHAQLGSAPDGVIGDRVFHLRRGERWTWHDRTWLALGGGVSLDKAVRVEGRDWWPEEEITAEQAKAVAADGPADVMVTHDIPSDVRHSFDPPPTWWDLADLARSDAHRERLQTVVDAVRPSWLIHGHLHRAYCRDVAMDHGAVSVTGLDRDGAPGNYAALNVATMEWEDDSG